MYNRLEEMTWPELQEAIIDGVDTALLVLGSIEQHGPHLPLGTDTILGYAWGEAIAERLGSTIVVPVVRPGLSRHHLGFAGTLTLEESTFQDVVIQICTALAQTGFRKVIPFCSHGGNWPAIFAMRQRLLDALPKGSTLVLLDRGTIDGIEDSIYAFLQGRGIEKPIAGTHAGLRETSHMLDIAASSVRVERVTCGWVGTSARPLIDKGKRILEFSQSGIIGDAVGSTEALGRELNDLTVRLYVDAFRKALLQLGSCRDGNDEGSWRLGREHTQSV